MTLLRRLGRASGLALAWGMVAALLLQPAAASIADAGRQPGELARVQMHGNPLRGVAYVSTWKGGGAEQPGNFSLRPLRETSLDGDPELNVRGNVYPIDVDGDGIFELLHFNGYRLMRVYDFRGRKLWQIGNRSGRVHRDASHRDTLAVFDVDGDGGQDVIHCWSEPDRSSKLLVARDGASGRVLKRAVLDGQGRGGECQLGAFRMAGRSEPIILVAASAPSSADCRSRSADVFSRTIAFRPDLTKLWDRVTCDAGHYVWPVDMNADGRAERLLVGKHLLAADGSRSCTLDGFGTDHVDSMTVADLDPRRPGLEVLAVGISGTGLFSAGSCARYWRISPSVIRDPQQASAAYVRDPAGSRFRMLVTTKRSYADETAPHRGFVLDVRGNVLSSYTERVTEVAAYALPLANANLDGAPSSEDRLTTFGQVIQSNGERRLGIGWYWNLQRLSAAERSLPIYDQWTSRPFAFDINNDGRDELITWGRRKLVVGTLAAGPS